MTLEIAPDLLVGWLSGLALGNPSRCGPLAIVPVYGGQATVGVPYRTLAEELATGEILISEKTHASVPTLQVINHSILPVLILDGEEVDGGLQNRVVNTTLLIPAASVFDLPVSCIEHGRWHESMPTFNAGEAVHPTLRRQKTEQVTASFLAMSAPLADQSAVWAEVDARHRRTGTKSATGALRDSYAQNSAELLEAERTLPCPDNNPTGVVALIDGRAVCADLFDRPETLRHYWTRLVRSYALEAVGVTPGAAEPQLDSARRLLDRPRRAVRTPFPSPGLGADVRVSGNGVVGAALVHDDTVLHAALFRHRFRGGDASLQSPRARARRIARDVQR
jgi:hypothetical protein